MIVLDRMLLGTIRFVLDKLSSAAEGELGDDEAALREDLMAAQMQLELGEIDDAELGRREQDIVARLRALREARGDAAVMAAGTRMVAEVETDGVPHGVPDAGPEAPRGGRRRARRTR